ncbi:MAG: TonB-dependent receptor [Pseudomonadota bacterium]
MPVDVLTAGDLKLEGSPSITDLVRNLGVSSGIDGETNQFASNGLEGTSNINLRGLGAARTLVLINGKRQVYSPFAIGEQAQLFVDTNQIPAAAIGRIEVLKDGAAALYGSDAIAGVVNFITRTDLEGLELSGSFETFEGTDGEYDLSAAYGWQSDKMSFLASAGYQYRNEVPLLEKDWAVLPFTENPVGGWSGIGNPGTFVPASNVAAAQAGTGLANFLGNQFIAGFADPGCTDLGAFQSDFGFGTSLCRFQFTQFDNLVEEEERYQLYSEFNYEFDSGMELHIEGLFANTDVPAWKTSPSYPPQQVLGQVDAEGNLIAGPIVPVDHPGLRATLANNPAFAAAVGGVDADGNANQELIFIGRSFGFSGFPGTGFGPQEGRREHTTYRISGDLSGKFNNGIDWTTSVVWAQSEADERTNDSFINGFANALQGFGVCSDANSGAIPAGAVAGEGGCEYYNPFSNSIAANAITGEANPNFDPALANSVELANWLTGETGTTVTNDLFVFDAIFSGESPLTAPGGNVGWAAGVQLRQEGREVDPVDLDDLTVNPGPEGNGPFSFLAGTTPFDDDRDIYAIFAEFQIPLYDNVDVQAAVRYEDYGGAIGSTLDPKLAAKWQVTDVFALRGNAQTSFRGPTLNQLSGVATTLQFVAPTGAFKAVDQFGNPDLEPETAFSYNVGAIYERGGFRGTIDYWSFDFEDLIIVESQEQIVGAALAAIGGGATDSPILSRITFQDPVNPSGAGIERIQTRVVNGPGVETSGLDVRGDYTLSELAFGELAFGGEVTYVFEYNTSPYEIDGVAVGGEDIVGQFNRSNPFRSQPQWKANLYANLATGPHNFRAVVRHIDSYDDERGDLTGDENSEIDSQTTLDLFYNVELPYEFDLGLSVVNVFDEDPPFAQFDLNYDPYTHNPFGRTFKVAVTKRFEGLGN